MSPSNPAFPIPTETLDDRLGFVGNSGSGKTYCAGTAVERVLERRGRVVIIDPLGVWWGLRLLRDGKSPSPHDIVIFGGEHGDLPLNNHAGALIGETVASIAHSAIIDLSGFGTKAAERRFMLAFLTAMYRHASKELVHLVFDEADMWCPQRIMDKEGEAFKLYGMMETIVRRGRVLGFIPWLITQRPAVLSKDVLSQADGLVIMKLTSSQDRDAIGDWVEGQADKAQWRSMWASLPTLQVGHGLTWIPGRGVLDTVSFPLKTTYDSSRAPKRGEVRKTAVLKRLDLPTLRDKLAAIEVEAKANDPRALHAEIARLKQNLSLQAQGDEKSDTRLKEAHQQGFAAGVAEHRSGLAAMFTELEIVWRDHQKAVEAFAGAIDRVIKAVEADPHYHVPEPSKPIAAGSRRREFKTVAGNVSGPQCKILAALSFWQSVGHDGPTRPMVAAVAGYKPSSGGFNNLLGAMRTAGLIDIPSPGHVSLTEAAFPHIKGRMSIEEARDFVLSVLSAPQRRLVVAASGFPEVSREKLAELTDYRKSSGGFNNLIGSLVTLDILDKPSAGHVALSEWARQILR